MRQDSLQRINTISENPRLAVFGRRGEETETVTLRPARFSRPVSFLCFKIMATSQIEKRIGCLIREQFPMNIIERNVRPEWLRRPDGNCLELDFYLPEVLLAFEIQGGQHYSYTPFFHKSIEDFHDQIERDKFKREACKQRGVYLIEVASEDEYGSIQHHIVDAIKQSEHKRLTDYILQRGSATILNIINLTISIQAKQAGQKPQGSAGKKNTSLETLIYNREINHELLRYISIRAIQDFYGLVPFRRPDRLVAIKQLRAQGKSIGRRHVGPKRRGIWQGMRQFA